MWIYKPIRITTICFIICNIKCTTQIKCLYSTCGIYRLGEHCKIIGKRLQNHVKYSAVQTIHAHHQTSYQDLKLSISMFCSHRLILWPHYWAPMHAHAQTKKAWVESGMRLLRTHHPLLNRLWIPAQWASAEIRVGHTERSTSEFSHHTVFFIKAIFQKAEHGERTAPASHALASSSRLTETPYTGTECHPWTNFVRVLNNAQKLWGPSSLQGVVNTTHMVRSLDKICIRSKLQTAGIFTKAQSWNMGDKGHYVQKRLFAWCVFSLASIHSHVLRDSGRGGSKDHNVLHFHRLHFTSNCCCTPRK